jgi:hypothetical protein
MRRAYLPYPPWTDTSDVSGVRTVVVSSLVFVGVVVAAVLKVRGERRAERGRQQRPSGDDHGGEP